MHRLPACCVSGASTAVADRRQGPRFHGTQSEAAGRSGLAPGVTGSRVWRDLPEEGRLWRSRCGEGRRDSRGPASVVTVHRKLRCRTCGRGGRRVLARAARLESSDRAVFLPLPWPSLASVSPMYSTSQPGLPRVQFCLPQRTTGTRGCDLCHGRRGSGSNFASPYPPRRPNPESPSGGRRVGVATCDTSPVPGRT